LSFISAGGELGPNARSTGEGGLVARRNRRREAAGIQGGQDRERDLGADALDGLQQAKPLALRVRFEAVEPDHVLPDMGLDREHGRLAGRGQALQSARRAVDDVADAVDVEDRMVLAIAVDHALELADHDAIRTSALARR
jgi:hypothetical protein